MSTYLTVTKLSAYLHLISAVCRKAESGANQQPREDRAQKVPKKAKELKVGRICEAVNVPFRSHVHAAISSPRLTRCWGTTIHMRCACERFSDGYCDGRWRNSCVSHQRPG